MVLLVMAQCFLYEWVIVTLVGIHINKACIYAKFDKLLSPTRLPLGLLESGIRDKQV